MTALRITGPGGILPRVARRELPGHSAQQAQNVNVSAGEWTPMRKPKFTWAPSSYVDPVLSVARLDDDEWLAWTAAHVRVERAPLEGAARYIITGDGVPKITTVALAIPVSATGGPAAVRALGIPTPAVAVTVTPSGGVGAPTTRFYCYTWVSTEFVEEGAPCSPSTLTTGKVDDTWAITGMVDTPPNTGSITGATKTATTVTAQTSAAHLLRVGDLVTVASVVGMTDLNGIHEVTALPAANQFTVALATSQSYTSGGTWTRQVPWGACTKRIYRTTGSTGAWQLVADGVTGTSYNDTLSDSQILGDDLISGDWTPPPGKLTGVVSMPGGMLWGWIDGDRVLCCCEPYQPHAWPERYQIKLPDDIVGLDTWDINLGVATQGMPVVLSGTDPTAMGQTRPRKPLPCVSRSSVCSIGRAVVYASRAGMAVLDLSDVTVFTEPMFRPEQWNALEPSTMQCAYDGRRLYFTSAPSAKLYVVDLIGDNAMVSAYQAVHALYADLRSGAMFFVQTGDVSEFDALDTAPQTFDWWSKEYVLPRPQNFGAARVELDDRFTNEALALIAAEISSVAAANAALMAGVRGGCGGIAYRALNVLEVNGSILEEQPVAEIWAAFTLYIGDTVIYSCKVPSGRVFRLPKGYRSDAFSVRLQSNTVVRSVAVAETPQELAKV